MAQVYLPERTEETHRPQRSLIPSNDDSHGAGTTGVTGRPLRRIGWSDIAVILFLIGVIALLVAGAGRVTDHSRSVNISLSPTVLPLYASFSLLRMFCAYVLSLIFTLVYGHIAATNKRAATFMVPILDILQSIPILSFLPAVVLTLVAIFPHSSIGVELAAIILIFTSQAWNMTFSFYHSAITLPADLSEAATVYHLSPWRRFFRLELPFSMIGLVWNSMMSWAGGWFFLIAAEQLTLGNQSFQLPGLGSYLQIAANNGNIPALILGLLTLVLMIVLLDFLFWRPLVAWSDKFKFEQTRTNDAPESPILDILLRSALLEWFTLHISQPAIDRFNAFVDRLLPVSAAALIDSEKPPTTGITAKTIVGWAITGILVVLALLGIVRALGLLAQVSLGDWVRLVGLGLLTLLRTLLAMAIAVAWTVPLGVKIGTNQKWSRRLQPIVQVVASIPATAVFPILLLFILRLPAGIDIAAILLMLLGTQWYVLFNVIAGAMAIPADLNEATKVYQVKGWLRWKKLILPAIFPYLVTGMITASGGAWNASIVAEIVTLHGTTTSTPGLGSEIALAATNNNLPILFAATLTMAAIVVTINRLVWRRLYRLAERRYSLG